MGNGERALRLPASNYLEKTRNRIRKNCKVDPVTRCWIWQKSINNVGIPQMGFNGTVHSALKVSILVFLQINATGIHVGSRCDNPFCVNPQHLYLGESLEFNLASYAW